MKENYYDPTTTMRRPSAFETQVTLATTPEGPLRASNLRFIALGLISIISLGASFSTSSTFAREYNQNGISLISLSPYIFFPMFGGAIADKWGVRGSLFVFGGLVALGSICLAISGGAIYLGVPLTIVGAGCLLAVQATIAAKWFRNKELALAIGSYLCMSKIGSLLGYVIVIDNYHPNDEINFDNDLSDFENVGGIQETIFNVGVVLSIISLFGILALLLLDEAADKQDSALCHNQGVQQNFETGPTGLKNYHLVFHLLATSILIQGVFLSLDSAFFNELVDSHDQINGMEFYTYVGIIFALLFPVYGFLVDRFGKKTFCLWVSSIIFTIICIIAIIVMLVNGVSHGLLQVFCIILDAIFQPIFLCVFWFCIPLVFEQKIMGTGAGIAISITNLMAFTVSAPYYLLTGSIPGDEDFPVFLIFVAIIAAFGTIFSIWLYKEDARNGGKLANPSAMKIAQNSNSFVSNSAFL